MKDGFLEWARANLAQRPPHRRPAAGDPPILGTQDIYEMYRAWAAEHGRETPAGFRGFAKAVLIMLPTARYGRIRTPGQGLVKGWNLCIRPQQDNSGGGA